MPNQDFKMHNNDFQRMEALSMSLVSLSHAFPLPESVVSVINEIADHAETLSTKFNIKEKAPELIE